MFLAILTFLACNETGVGALVTPPDLEPTPTVTPPPEPSPTPPTPDGPSGMRDTDGDGVPDDQDDDIDGDGLDNANDPDPDGDGQPGYTLPLDPADDPPIDPNTGLPVLEEGGARGRICAPNGTTWVAGADINIITPDGGYSAVSNGDGWWQIDGLAPGTYGVVITKGSFYLTYNVTIEDGVVSEQVYDECLVQGDLTIAVVNGEWDHVEELLSDLNLTFSEYDGNITTGDNQPEDTQVTNLLTNAALLAQYDVLFLNCGISEDWATINQPLVAQTLRDYVEAGGSIYASDWSYYAIEAAFPEKISFYGDDLTLGSARVGDQGAVAATVVDPAMSTLLGSNVADLVYDLNQWVVLDTIDPAVETLVEGTPPSLNGNPATQASPLSVRFSSGAGRVIYTTFHNEGLDQNGNLLATPDMVKMLEEIVLSL